MSNQSITRVPHKHAEVIKAWADGAQIESRYGPCAEWEASPTPSWGDNFQYRAKLEKVYPATQMMMNDFNAALHGYKDCVDVMVAVAIANAALRHAIDANQIISMTDHQDALMVLGRNLRGIEIARLAARDMAIAEAVHKAALVNANAYSGGLHAHLLGSIDLATIIAKVRP